MIRTQNICKAYGNLQVLKSINLEVNKGEVVSIVGASGAGKSTLLHILGTLDRPCSGSVYYDQVQVNDLQGKKMARFRNRSIGFVFQFHHLLPEFTAIENVCMPAFIGGTTKKQAAREAEKLLEIMNLTQRKDHKPDQLSGGEQQRVAVARALINQPKVVLADEPSGNLDSESSNQLHQLFFHLRNKLNSTFVIATHNHDLANMADRKMEMKDGKLV